jgi:hypothetical protein
MKRHSELTERFASNIKCTRAGVVEETLHEYIDNLKEVVLDVPPTHLEPGWSQYDPGKKKSCRGTKYPEKICNFSKSSTSIMIRGNAPGDVLPPYVVYKSAQMWTAWADGGPPGCQYHHSALEWFDAVTYDIMNHSRMQTYHLIQWLVWYHTITSTKEVWRKKGGLSR